MVPLSRRPHAQAFRCVCLDWGGTLMADDGPADLPMALWPEVHAIAGAREMLEALAPRWRIAIATNASVSDGPLVLRALERASLDEHVSAVFCSNEIGARKETRAFWEAVGSSLGVGLGEIAMLERPAATVSSVPGPRSSAGRFRRS